MHGKDGIAFPLNKLWSTALGEVFIFVLRTKYYVAANWNYA